LGWEEWVWQWDTCGVTFYFSREKRGQLSRGGRSRNQRHNNNDHCYHFLFLKEQFQNFITTFLLNSFNQQPLIKTKIITVSSFKKQQHQTDGSVLLLLQKIQTIISPTYSHTTTLSFLFLPVIAPYRTLLFSLLVKKLKRNS